jgi:antitoxin component YwqK of YwqJK toxin-antitoxin module
MYILAAMVLTIMMVCSGGAALAGMAVCIDGVSLNVTGSRVLREILSASELPTARVERVSSTVEEQARIIYDKLIADERSGRKRDLYGPAETQVQTIFDENRRIPRDEVIAMMVAALSSELKLLKEQQAVGEKGKQGEHSEAPGYTTFDVVPSSLGTIADRERFLIAVKNHPETIRFFYPPVDKNTYHIELFDLPETGAAYLPDPHVPRSLVERRHSNGAIAERYEQTTVGIQSVKYGKYERFSEKGELLESGLLECGRRTGEWKTYEYAKGNQYLRRDEYFQNGKNHGAAHIYWAGKQQLFEEGYYENGRKQGRWVEYTTEGFILKESTYQKGILHGPYKIHQVAMSMTRSYVRTSGNYINGQREGRWESFRENEKLLEEGNYVHDKKHGPWKSYGDIDQVDVISIYVRGKLISRQALERDGQARN